MDYFNFITKQEGYGRQGLYFIFDGKQYFIQSIFPNVPEYFNDYELLDDCFFNESTEMYTDCNGHEVTPINSWNEFLTEKFKEKIGSILCDELDSELYDFDFEGAANYTDVADWALNY